MTNGSLTKEILRQVKRLLGDLPTCAPLPHHFKINGKTMAMLTQDFTTEAGVAGSIFGMQVYFDAAVPSGCMDVYDRTGALVTRLYDLPYDKELPRE